MSVFEFFMLYTIVRKQYVMKIDEIAVQGFVIRRYTTNRLERSFNLSIKQLQHVARMKIFHNPVYKIIGHSNPLKLSIFVKCPV